MYASSNYSTASDRDNANGKFAVNHECDLHLDGEWEVAVGEVIK